MNLKAVRRRWRVTTPLGGVFVGIVVVIVASDAVVVIDVVVTADSEKTTEGATLAVLDWESKLSTGAVSFPGMSCDSVVTRDIVLSSLLTLSIGVSSNRVTKRSSRLAGRPFLHALFALVMTNWNVLGLL